MLVTIIIFIKWLYFNMQYLPREFLKIQSLNAKVVGLMVESQILLKNLWGWGFRAFLTQDYNMNMPIFKLTGGTRLF